MIRPPAITSSATTVATRVLASATNAQRAMSRAIIRSATCAAIVPTIAAIACPPSAVAGSGQTIVALAPGAIAATIVVSAAIATAAAMLATPATSVPTAIGAPTAAIASIAVDAVASARIPIAPIATAVRTVAGALATGSTSLRGQSSSPRPPRSTATRPVGSSASSWNSRMPILQIRSTRLASNTPSRSCPTARSHRPDSS